MNDIQHVLTWHTKAGNSLATAAGTGSDVHHARLLALGAVGGLLLPPVGKVGLSPAAETLAGCGPHVDHIICLAPARSCYNVLKANNIVSCTENMTSK